MLKAFFLAISYMTRVPVPQVVEAEPLDLARAALFYPLAGLLIGIVLMLPILVFSGSSPFLLAAIVTVTWAAITGSLHLTGVGSSADAWLGGRGDEEKTHKILKDPVVGAAGVTAISAVMILKFTLTLVLLEQGYLWSILFAPVFGRSLILLLFLTTPYVRAEGRTSAVSTYLPRDLARLVLAVCFLLAVVISLKGLLLLLAGYWVMRRLMMQRLQGCTGETAGASVEIGEVFWLLGVALQF
jgi:adenosylcobinamide-GDP ribazoletransferase